MIHIVLGNNMFTSILTRIVTCKVLDAEQYARGTIYSHHMCLYYTFTCVYYTFTLRMFPLIISDGKVRGAGCIVLIKMIYDRRPPVSLFRSVYARSQSCVESNIQFLSFIYYLSFIWSWHI